MTIKTEVKSRLLDKLPHGSGINGEWVIIRSNKQDDTILAASNHYDAMTEYGMYCHCYNFTVKVKYNGIGQYKPCELCHGHGMRFVEEMIKYRPNMTWDTMVEWLNSQGFGPVEDKTFPCNYCNGFGKLPLHEFEFISLNFHGQREYSCCGYDLKNYLSDTIAESLTIDN